MKSIKAGLVALALMLFVTGCSIGSFDSDNNKVQIGKDGSITGAIVEEFAESYYSDTELEEMVNETVEEYNSSGEKIKVDKLEIKNGIAKLIMEYDSANDYAEFNGVDFFYGTISDAMDAGYDFAGTFVSSEDDSTLSTDALKALDNYKVVIFEEDMDVEVNSNILYSNDYANVTDKKIAALTEDADGLAYIVFE